MIYFIINILRIIAIQCNIKNNNTSLSIVYENKKAFGPIDAFESFAINSTYHGDEMSLVWIGSKPKIWR